MHTQDSRFTFYTENIFFKLLFNPKDRMISEDETTLFMKLTVVSVKESRLVNLNGP